MAYGLNMYSETSDSYQNKKRGVSSIYTPSFSSSFESRVPVRSDYTRQSIIGSSNPIQPIKKKRSMVDRIFDLISVGQYAVQGAIYGVYDDESTVLGNIAKGVLAANPFGGGYDEGEFSFARTQELIAGPTKSVDEAVGRFGSSLAVDVLTDPLTYMTFGIAPLLKGTGKVSKGIGQAAKFATGLTDDMAAHAIRTSGQSVTPEKITRLVQQVNNYGGVANKTGTGIGFKLGNYSKTFVDEDTLRMLGDRTVAPYVNAAIESFKNRRFTGSIDGMSELRVLARSNPEEAAKKLLAFDLVKGHNDGMLKRNFAVKKRAKKMFGTLNEDDLTRLFGLIEDSTQYGKTLSKIDINDTEAAKEIIAKYNSELDFFDKKIAEAQAEFEMKRGHYDNIGAISEVLADNYDESYKATVSTGSRIKDLEYMKKDLLASRDALIKSMQPDFTYSKRKHIQTRTSVELDQRLAGNEVEFGNAGEEIDKASMRKFKAGTVKGNKVIAKIPHGVTPTNGFAKIQAGNIDLGNTSDLFSKSASEYLTVSGKHPHGTKKDTVTYKFEQNMVDNKQAQKIVTRLVRSNPLLAGEMKFGNIKTNLSVEEAKKFIDTYYNSTADEMIHELDKYKEGYSEAMEMLTEQGFGYKIDELKLNRIDLQAQLVKFQPGSKKAERAAIVEELSIIDEEIKRLSQVQETKLNRYLVDDELRIADWFKFIDNRYVSYTGIGNSKLKASVMDTRRDLSRLISKANMGVANKEDLYRLEALRHQLKTQTSALRKSDGVESMARKFDEGDYITDQEVEAILTREGTGEFREAIDDAYFDPFGMGTKTVIDEVTGKQKGAIDYVDPTEAVMKQDVDKRKLKMSLEKDIKVKRAKIAELEAELSVKGYDPELKSKIENLSTLIRKSETQLRSSINDSYKSIKDVIKEELIAKLQSEGIPVVDIKQKYKFLGLHDPIMRANDALVNIDKHKILSNTERKIQLLKQYFPDKSYAQLLDKEKAVIDAKLIDEARRGLVAEHVPGMGNKVLAEHYLKKIDLDISKLDPEMAELTSRLAAQESLYHKAGTSMQNIVLEFDKALNNMQSAQTKLDDLVKRRETLRSAIDNCTIEQYFKSTLSADEFDNLFYKLTDKVEFFDPDVEKKFGHIARSIMADFEKIAKLEGIENVRDAYVYHMVKDEYKDMFFKQEEFNELADKLGIGNSKFNVHELKRKINLTVAQYKANWDIGEYREYPRDLFEENMAKVYVARMLNSNRLITDKNNHKVIMELLTKPKKGSNAHEALSYLKDDEVLAVSSRDFLDSARYNYAKSKGTIDYITMADMSLKKFDKLRDAFIVIDKDELKTMPPRLTDFLFSQSNVVSSAAIQQLNKGAKYQFSDGVRSFLDMYDKMLHLWKLNVTAVNPGFHVRNKIGNTFNNYLDIGEATFDRKFRNEIKDIVAGKSGSIVDKNGKSWSYDELFSVAEDLGVLDKGFFGLHIRSLMENNGAASKWAKYQPWQATEFIPYKTGTKVGSAIENHDRMLNFVWHIKDGKTAQHAKEMTDKFLFDYNTATEFEKDVIRRVIPFWTWIKSNVPLMSEQLLSQPHKFLPFVKARNAMNNSVNEEDRIDRAYVNDFALDWWQMPFNITNEEGRSENVMFNPNLPYQDLSTAGNLMAKLSPFIKVPYEIATNQHSFYDQPIYSTVGEAPLKTADHIMSQLTPYNTGKSIIRKQGPDRTLEIFAYLTGLRFVSYDAEKYKAMKIQEELTKGDYDARPLSSNP